jgi:hypothetical protein
MTNPPDSDPSNHTELDPPLLHILAKNLYSVGLAFLVFYLAAVILVLLPPQLFSPAWQLQAVKAVLTNAVVGLLGLAMVQLAAALSPASRWLLTRRDRLASLARLAVLGFLLVIPLQISAMSSLHSQLKSEQGRQERQREQGLSAYQRAITGATNVEDLQRRLQGVQGPTLTPADRRLPLPELKQVLLRGVEMVRRQSRAQRQAITPPSRNAMIREGAWVTISSLAMAAGFASLTSRWGHELSLFQHWQQGWLNLSSRTANRRPRKIVDADYIAQISDGE